MDETLTFEAMEENADAALALPLPPAPSAVLLDDAAIQVLDYLDWLTFWWDGELTAEELARKMEAAIARLLEIALLIPAAHAAEPRDWDPQTRFQLPSQRGFGPWSPAQ